MELPRRQPKDVYVKPGEYRDLERRLRLKYDVSNIPVVVAYAFDWRTRLGPFLFTDRLLIPAGPRAVGAALWQAGFRKLRIVLGEWTPHFRPSLARLDGELPQLLLVSSMQIHSAHAYQLIEDAWQLGPNRPLILAGGAKAIYEPWDFFGLGPEGRYGADVVVTGEEFVLLQLLERILEHRVPGESMLSAFQRVHRLGLLEDIPGLVYPEDDSRPPTRLINTGIQRLVQDLDELPHPIIGLSLLERAHSRPTLCRDPIPLSKLRRYGRFVSLVTTHGCKFHCPYCPIPAYNQYTFRYKTPERLVDEMRTIVEQTSLHTFFGTDDNFFNNRLTVQETFEAMARAHVGKRPFREAIWFGTEATEYDVYKNRDLLPLGREAGLRAIWFGIEDMTAELVKKGQSPEKTRELFQLMNRLGIAPMSMMMHHDGQPLHTKDSLYGLLNQVNYLRRVGSASVQVTFLTPSVGSRSWEETFESGIVMRRVNGKPVEDFRYDGNHCIATEDPKPWRKQLNLIAAYAAFYNPVNFLRTAYRIWDKCYYEKMVYQVYGMAAVVRSALAARHWIWDLMKGPIERYTTAPGAKFPMIPARTTDPRLVHYLVAS
jgi:radical SAM superfamily enzyme YgiQ (UPF0313 family)